MNTAAKRWPSYGTEIDRAIDNVGLKMGGRLDWLRLARACLDQAGDRSTLITDREALKAIEALIGEAAHEDEF